MQMKKILDAFHEAICFGHFDTMKKILDAFHEAICIWGGHFDTMKKILDAQFCNLNALYRDDNLLHNFLRTAVWHNDRRMVRELIKRGASVLVGKPSARQFYRSWGPLNGAWDNKLYGILCSAEVAERKIVASHLAQKIPKHIALIICRMAGLL
jgi:hypothetical protein